MFTFLRFKQHIQRFIWTWWLYLKAINTKHVLLMLFLHIYDFFPFFHFCSSAFFIFFFFWQSMSLQWFFAFQVDYTHIHRHTSTPIITHFIWNIKFNDATEFHGDFIWWTKMRKSKMECPSIFLSTVTMRLYGRHCLKFEIWNTQKEKKLNLTLIETKTCKRMLFTIFLVIAMTLE